LKSLNFRIFLLTVLLV